MAIFPFGPSRRGGVDEAPGGSDNGGMDLLPRVAKLEAAVEHIQVDIADIKKDIRALLAWSTSAFLITWGGLIAVALGLAYLMAKGFHWL